MKTLFIECGSGAAGDMLMSALLELHPQPDDIIKRLNALIPNVNIKKETTEQNGIKATHIRVIVNGAEESDAVHSHDGAHSHSEHGHRHLLKDINALINSLSIDEKVKSDALAVYSLLAGAEARVHGTDMDNIHFHEVGTLDAVCDIVGVCMLFNEIGIENIMASPVNTGGGFVSCAHGILPVPAPATVQLLSGLPFYSEGNEGEKCTPTGAALLKYFVKKFGDMPVLTLKKVGMGAGTKKFKSANILRIFMGETDDTEEYIYEICCNIDDMTGEDIAFACDRLFEAGAKDVFTSAVYMKKGRPAQLLTCIAAEEERADVIKAIFKYTSTIGIRERKCKRYLMERFEEKKNTAYGDINFKISRGFGTKKTKPEFEDIKNAALNNGLSPDEIRREINK